MSQPIRFELTGRNAEQFNRVFEKLAGVLMNGIMEIAPDADEETRESIEDIAEISKDWISAKLNRPGLENELLAAGILEKFEEIKFKQAQRESVEIDNESKRLDLLIKRFETAATLMRMLNNSFVYEDGKLTLLLTNENLAVLRADMKALSQHVS